MARGVSAPVGKRKRNNPDDVRQVQGLLNPFAPIAGFGKLKLDGDFGPKTAAAIGAFQLKVCKFKPDYVISPRKRTINMLLAGPAKVKTMARAADKAKVSAKKKAVQEAVKEAEKAAKSQNLEESSWGGIFDKIEAYADELYDDFLGLFEKKSEATPEDAKKIADKVIKEAQKKAAEEAKAAAKKEAGNKAGLEKQKTNGKVTGDISGVNRTVINILTEVSAFYDVPIHVVSGKRSQARQANAMYNNWTGNLKNGNAYKYLQNKKELRKELDDLKKKRDKAGFVDHLNKNVKWKYISRHLSGGAVDVALKTNPKVIQALRTCLFYYPETNSEGIGCHHFSDKKLIWPIKDSVKAKWKK